MSLLFLWSCSEFVLRESPVVPPADPPADDPDAAFGDPPDWSTCSSGWYGQYYNLPGDHPDLEPDPLVADVSDMDDVDWWEADRLAFRRYDPSLDFGSNWWPVEQGIEGDPAYFATRWTAWMRVTSGSTVDIVMGAQSVAWLEFDGEPVAEVPLAESAQEAMDAQVYTLPVRAGQFPVELRFGQLEAGASGFRFRIVSGDAVLCYPDFSGE
ncbi:MAG: hypothetical protein Q8P18_23385 [Pseudomonadota bacterium]|nr:hypothetical protein [Pseudomonadota bacterium]